MRESKREKLLEKACKKVANDVLSAQIRAIRRLKRVLSRGTRRDMIHIGTLPSFPAKRDATRPLLL